MTETAENTKQTEAQVHMINKDTANVLSSFVAQVSSSWTTTYGNKADYIQIVYYPEDDGFEVYNNEENNGVLKRNRATLFRADILSWAANEIRKLQGFDMWSKKDVTAFTCIYQDGKYGVLVETTNAVSQ